MRAAAIWLNSTTLAEKDVESVIELSFGNNSISDTIDEAYDPPLQGMEHDRIERQESYIKNFRPMNLGRMNRQAGRGLLTLKT